MGQLQREARLPNGAAEFWFNLKRQAVKVIWYALVFSHKKSLPVMFCVRPLFGLENVLPRFCRCSPQSCLEPSELRVGRLSYRPLFYAMFLPLDEMDQAASFHNFTDTLNSLARFTTLWPASTVTKTFASAACVFSFYCGKAQVHCGSAVILGSCCRMSWSPASGLDTRS